MDDIEIYTVTTTKEAQEDLLNLEKFYYEHAGLESAVRFEEAVNTVLEMLSVSPYSNRRFSDDFDETIRRVVLPKRKVTIVYRIDGDKLEVIAIATGHNLSDPSTLITTITERIKENDN